MHAGQTSAYAMSQVAATEKQRRDGNDKMTKPPGATGKALDCCAKHVGSSMCDQQRSADRNHHISDRQAFKRRYLAAATARNERSTSRHVPESLRRAIPKARGTLTARACETQPGRVHGVTSAENAPSVRREANSGFPKSFCNGTWPLRHCVHACAAM